MAAVFVESPRVMRRRNVAALLAVLVVTSTPNTVNVPVGSLTLTGFAPTFTQITPNGFTSPTGAITLTGFAPTFSVVQTTNAYVQASFIDRSNVQPRRNVAAALQAIGNPPLAPNGFTMPAGGLTLTAFAPTIAQGSLVLGGQDLQAEAYAEYWQPERRNLLFALAQPGTNSFNVPTAGLTLTGFAPSIGVSGTVFIPTASLTLAGFAPTFAQAASGRIDIPLGSLSLTGFAPSFGVSGTLFIPTASLTLTGYAPQFVQGQANAGGPRYIIKRLRGRRWIVSATTYLQFDPKGPDEKIKLTFDFTPDLPLGVLLAGTPTVTYTVASGFDATPASLANGAPSPDGTGKQVIVPVQGGIQSCSYSIRAVCATTDPLITLGLTGILKIST